MDVTIIGGGASGIACAVKIKQNNPDSNVVVLEHLDEVCKKIYATGNGRCNITNQNADGYEITKEFLESLGLYLRHDSSGRIYPYSNQAASVVDVLKNACKKYNINIVCACTPNKVEKIGTAYNVYTNKGAFTSDVLVLATGGMAQSALGSDGSGYSFAKALGHTITDLSPALVQLKSSSKNCRALKGVRTKCNVKIKIDGKTAGEEYGELLFAEYGISGIVTMDLSEHVHDEKLKNKQEKCTAVIDFVPELSEEYLINHYRKFGSFDGILPKRLCAILAKQANGDYLLMAKYIKNWNLIITGTKGYPFAQITKGGVASSEISDCNESLINKNLYLLGELTDHQFKCGGFNLDYAVSSGIKAANNITSRTYDKN